MSSEVGLHAPILEPSDAIGVRAGASYYDDAGSWSPDGQRVAFSAIVTRFWNEDSCVLFVVDANGSNLRPLTTHVTPFSQRFPAWAPDGRTLVFSMSGFDEFWGRFGRVGAGVIDVTTLTITEITSHDVRTSLMSPQSWRR